MSDSLGKALVRMPKTLHLKAAAEATKEGVSLNTWLVMIIADAVGYERGFDESQPKVKA